jgi:HEAT repeat protein
MALHAIAWHCGDSGTISMRQRFVAAVSGVLRSNAPSSVKAFLLRQLQVVAAEESVEAVAAFLDDEELCAPATATLQAVGNDSAKAALLDALPEAPTVNRVSIMGALGDLRVREAADVLAKETLADDPQVRRLALDALARIGGPDAAPLLQEAMEANSWREYANNAACMLEYLLHLAENGHRKLATDILFSLWDSSTGDASTPIHVRIAALATLADVLGPDSTGRVIQALADENVELRAAAQYIAVNLRGAQVVDRYLHELENLPPRGKVALLRVLAERKAADALPEIKACLRDKDQEVRAAAIQAAIRLGGAEVVPDFVTLLAGGTEQDRKEARRSLVNSSDPRVNHRLSGLLREVSSEVGAHLISILADRHAYEEMDVLLRASTHPGRPVRLAAIDAIGRLADADAVEHLLGLLVRAEDDRERQQVEEALTRVCQRAEAAGQCTGPLLGGFHTAAVSDQASLLRVLGSVGGSEALDAILAALDGPQEELRDAAADAIMKWTDVAAAPALLARSRQIADVKAHVLLLRAYANLVSLDEALSVQQRLDMYSAGLDASRRNEEKKLFLARLGEVPDERTAELLELFLAEPGLSSEAAAAMIRVAEGLLPAQWPAARDILERLSDRSVTADVSEQFEAATRRLQEFGGFITDWWVAGPYMVQDMEGNELLEVSFPPEQPGAEGVAWKKQPVTADPSRYWFIDLLESIGGEHRAAYLRTRVYSPREQSALLEVGSDDGIAVWLNGASVHKNKILRVCGRGQDKIEVLLRAGWNDLLLKVTNNGGGWAASARVRASDGGPLEGVYAKAEPEDGD